MPQRSYPNYEHRTFHNFEFTRTAASPRNNANARVFLTLAALVGISRVFSVLYKRLDGAGHWRRRYEARLVEKEAVEFLFESCGGSSFSILSHYSAF